MECIILGLQLLLFGVSAFAQDAPGFQWPMFYWKDPYLPPLKAVAVVAHGLNLKPSKMHSIGEVLRQQGVGVVEVALTGHHMAEGEDLEAFQHVSADRWMKEMDVAMKEAITRRKTNDGKEVPIYFVGYSLGALLGEVWMNERKKNEINRAYLIAPSLRVRLYASWIKIFSLLGESFMVPSANLEEYRVQSGTSMAAYHAQFEIRARLERLGYKNSNIPTQVLLAKEDEIIDNVGVRKMAFEQSLTQWSFLELSNEGSRLLGKKRHLMVDEKTFGPEAWTQFVYSLKTHFLLAD